MSGTPVSYAIRVVAGLLAVLPWSGYALLAADIPVEPLPEATKQVAPIYPDSARRAGIVGTVLVQALVGKDGLVRETRVIRSVRGLDDAAVAAVKQWLFKPATANAQPVSVWVGVPFRFGPGDWGEWVGKGAEETTPPPHVWAVVVRPDTSLSLLERVAFYVARLGDSTYIEYIEHGEPRAWLVAAEELGTIGAPALPILIHALGCSEDAYERTQIFYALRLAAQGPGTEDAEAQAELRTILTRFPLAYPPESEHASLKAVWLRWWGNHRESLSCSSPP